MTSKKSPWREAVIYQVYPWTFNEDSERRPQLGNGSIRGITEKLPYLNELGIDALWISPPYRSPMIDAGYDISNQIDINPSLGTITDMDELITKAHELGIRMMLDFVPNHTSDQHEWFQKSRRRQEGYDDWYIWHPGTIDDQGNRVVPNNWGSVFSIPNKKARERGEMPQLAPDEWTPPISAWQFDDIRQEFYLRSYAKEQPDLNWSNPYVREAEKNVMRYWLDKGVDGFRVDVANHLAKNMEFPDEAINLNYNESDFENPYDQLMKYQSCAHPEELDQYIWEMGQVLKEEHYHGRDLRLILEAYMDKRVLQSIDAIIPEVASSFNFGALRLDWNAAHHKEQTDYYYAHLHKKNVANQVNGNHDNPRLATKLGDKHARAAVVMNLFMPGMRFIYNGEELGLHNADIPTSRMQDPNGLRDEYRTPMIWDDSELNGGFSNADPHDLWLPTNKADELLSVSRQNTDTSSSLALYESAIRLCRELPVLRMGDYVAIETNNHQVFAYGRSTTHKRAVVAINFSSDTQHFKISGDDFIPTTAIFSSIDLTLNIHKISNGENIQLRPNEALLFLCKPFVD